MKIIKKIAVKASDGGRRVIDFGQPETKEELDEMFKFRYRVYARKSFINKNQEKRDYDAFDKEGKCFYFIAKLGNQIIGSTRLIVGRPLPSEKEYFEMDLPEEIKSLSADEVVEVGRLSAYIDDPKVKIPRHLVLLGLFYSMVKFAEKNNFKVCLGGMKEYVKDKLDSINFPLKEVKGYKLIYNPKKHGDPLDEFFNHHPKYGGVVAIYCFLDEAKKYFDSIFENKICFSKSDGVLNLRSVFLFNLRLFFKKII